MSNCLYVGIDLGLNNFVVRTMNDQGKEISGKSTFSNDLVGTEHLVDKLLNIARSTAVKELKFGMEATNLYWWHLHKYLTHNDQLQSFKTEIYVLNFIGRRIQEGLYQVPED